MKNKRKIELLAPAKTADIGIEAIRHGADAVYIGAHKFGARASAGNSIKEIAKLCDYAHLFDAKVYITLNTILYDNELSEAEQVIKEVYQAGADALIVQDLGVLQLDLPPIALHASTQMDITTPSKAYQLEQAGFSQIVLARELSLVEIKAIHQQVNVPIEAFVHGALCVSYSGRCYVSQHCFGRSANRGNCAQFCRLAFDLVNENDEVLIANSHLLSLKDLNRSSSIEKMIEAGVSSFKIEGRLKELSYVKNITSHYRKEIDDIIAKHSDRLVRSSYGQSEVNFVPQPEKSFNRGFTDYFLHRRSSVSSVQSPKSKGELIGKVTYNQGDGLRINTSKELHAGDGLCFINDEGKLEGFRINTLANGKIRTSSPISISLGTTVFRNHDHLFEKQLNKATAERKIKAQIRLEESKEGFKWYIEDEGGYDAELSVVVKKELARNDSSESIRKNMSKTGNTPFLITTIDLPENKYFFPPSLLSEWRRLLIEELEKNHRHNYKRPKRHSISADLNLPKIIDYRGNVSNHLAKSFYLAHGSKEVAPAYELSRVKRALLMTCKHCILYDSGHCLKRDAPHPSWQLPLHLQLSDGRRFGLDFDCKQCEMYVTTYE